MTVVGEVQLASLEVAGIIREPEVRSQAFGVKWANPIIVTETARPYINHPYILSGAFTPISLRIFPSIIWVALTNFRRAIVISLSSGFEERTRQSR